MGRKKQAVTTKPEKAPVGRPSKLNKDVQDRIAGAIRAGSYIETAAALAGINKDTFYDWLRRGGRGEPDYKNFSDAVEKALADGEMRDLMVIDRAAQGRPAQFLYVKGPDGKDTSELVKDADGNPIMSMPATRPEWTAAAWRLERKFPKRWGRKEVIALTEEDPTPETIDSMTPEERKAKIDELLARRKAREPK